MGVYLTGVHLIGVCLMIVHLMGISTILKHRFHMLKGVHLTGVHLMGVYLTGVHLMGVYLMGVHLMGRVSHRRDLTGLRRQGKEERKKDASSCPSRAYDGDTRTQECIVSQKWTDVHSVSLFVIDLP
jgi:hypothetical protein